MTTARKPPAKTAASRPKRASSSRPKPEAPRIEPPATVRSRIESSVAAASWLSDTDAGAVQLALKLASIVDELGADPETIKTAAPALTVLARLLNDLGLTTRGKPEPEGTVGEVSWLDELRQSKAVKASR